MCFFWAQIKKTKEERDEKIRFIVVGSTVGIFYIRLWCGFRSAEGKEDGGGKR